MNQTPFQTHLIDKQNAELIFKNPSNYKISDEELLLIIKDGYRLMLSATKTKFALIILALNLEDKLLTLLPKDVMVRDYFLSCFFGTDLYPRIYFHDSALFIRLFHFQKKIFKPSLFDSQKKTQLSFKMLLEQKFSPQSTKTIKHILSPKTPILIRDKEVLILTIIKHSKMFLSLLDHDTSPEELAQFSSGTSFLLTSGFGVLYDDIINLVLSSNHSFQEAFFYEFLNKTKLQHTFHKSSRKGEEKSIPNPSDLEPFMKKLFSSPVLTSLAFKNNIEAFLLFCDVESSKKSHPELFS